MKIIYKKLQQLKPYTNNPRQNDHAVDAVAESIKSFGFKVPIIAEQDGTIIAGHTRLKAAEQLGLEQVPVIIADDLTSEQIKAFRLADNKVGELALWDTDMLAEELLELHNLKIDMEPFGFETADQLMSGLIDDTAAIDDLFPEDPISKPGDLWILGRHRVLCGDSTKPASYTRLMADRKANLLLTDPPYNVGYVGGTAEALTIQNDNMDKQSFIRFLTAALGPAVDALHPGAAFYIWHADTTRGEFLSAAEVIGLEIRQVLIWIKNTMVLGRQDYQWAHEPCLYGWKDGAAHYFIDDRTLWTVFDEIERPRLSTMKKQELVDLINNLLNQHNLGTTVLRENKPAASIEHPTMKPVRLMARQILNSTRTGEIVLDPFGGSGSTLIASEQINRTCYTIELDPRYTDTIVARWERLTGQKARRQ